MVTYYVNPETGKIAMKSTRSNRKYVLNPVGVLDFENRAGGYYDESITTGIPLSRETIILLNQFYEYHSLDKNVPIYLSYFLY